MKTIIESLSILLVLFSCTPSGHAGLAPQMVVVEGGSSGLGDFEMAIFPTTVGEWREYVHRAGIEFDFDERRSWFGSVNSSTVNDQSPMLYVNLYEAVAYANWLSRSRGLRPAYRIPQDGEVIWDRGTNGYRLPTSAEWEWAARGGVLSRGYRYPGSNDLDEVAWYNEAFEDPSQARAQPVGSKKPNELGIYDMFGGAQEWVWDRVLVYEQARNLPGEWELPSGRFAVIWDEDMRDIEFATAIKRLTRGHSYWVMREWFEYGLDKGLWEERHVGTNGLRLVRSLR